MGDKPCILLSISDTGGGHRAGATAINAALEQLVGSSVDRHIVDMLASTGTPFLRDAPNLYDQLSTRWLPVYDFLYKATDGPRRIELITQLVYWQAHRNVRRVLEETDPDLVVSVHQLSNGLLGHARRMYNLPFRFVYVATDLVTLHAASADPDVEVCIVPTDEAYQRQLRRGIPASKLVCTGFPVHPKFAAYTGEKEDAREALNLDPQRFTVLVTSGGVGSGNVREIVQMLDRAYPEHQLLVVTGKNAALRDELRASGLGAHVHVYGFVTNMEVLMAASDIVVSKAGPGTLMEALVMRRPVIVTEAVGVQEQGNIDFVLNHELGLFCPTLSQIVPALAELMQPAVYSATIARLANAVPRDGALQIAKLLLEQLALAPPPRRRRMQLPTLANWRAFRARRPTLRAFSQRGPRGGRLRLPRIRRPLQ